jgi:hypothetical protein
MDQAQAAVCDLEAVEAESGAIRGAEEAGCEPRTGHLYGGQLSRPVEVSESPGARQGAAHGLLRLARNSEIDCQPLAQSAEPPYADPHVRWCGRGGAARLPPVPIADFRTYEFERSFPRGTAPKYPSLTEQATRRPPATSILAQRASWSTLTALRRSIRTPPSPAWSLMAALAGALTAITQLATPGNPPAGRSVPHTGVLLSSRSGCETGGDGLPIEGLDSFHVEVVVDVPLGAVDATPDRLE